MGRPTMFEAPTTVARSPDNPMPYSCARTYHAERRARPQARPLLREQAGVVRVKAVYILGGIHQVHDFIGIQALGQG